MDATPDREPTYPRPATAWWGVGLFTLGAVLSYTDRQILAFLVDPIRASLHITDTQVSILQGAAFAVLYSLIGLPLGRIADLVPRRALLILAIGLWSLGTAACGFAHSFGALFAARLLVGIGEAALAPAAISLIGDYFPAQRHATALGVFLTGIVIGAGAAIAVGGSLLQLAQTGLLHALPVLGILAPWRIVLVLAGLVGVAVGALMFTLHEPAGRRFSVRDLTARIAGLGGIIGTFRLHARILGPLYAAMALWSIVDYAILSWTPALLMRRFGLSPGDVGASLGLVAIVGGLVGTPLGGYITDLVTARRGVGARFPLLFAVALAGTLGIPLGLMAGPTGALASAGAWIFVSSAIGTISIATVLDILPQENRGLGTSTIAFNNTIIGLGLGPTLVALATDRLFQNPSALGFGMSTVIAPSVIGAISLYAVAMLRAGHASACARTIHEQHAS